MSYLQTKLRSSKIILKKNHTILHLYLGYKIEGVVFFINIKKIKLENFFCEQGKSAGKDTLILHIFYNKCLTSVQNILNFLSF